MPTRALHINRILYWDTKRYGGIGIVGKKRCNKSIVSDTSKLSKATEALSKLKDGKIIGRGVINP